MEGRSQRSRLADFLRPLSFPPLFHPTLELLVQLVHPLDQLEHPLVDCADQPGQLGLDLVVQGLELVAAHFHLLLAFAVGLGRLKIRQLVKAFVYEFGQFAADQSLAFRNNLLLECVHVLLVDVVHLPEHLGKSLYHLLVLHLANAPVAVLLLLDRHFHMLLVQLGAVEEFAQSPFGLLQQLDQIVEFAVLHRPKAHGAVNAELESVTLLHQRVHVDPGNAVGQ